MAEMWSTTVVGTTKLHYSGRGWASFATQLTAPGHLSSKAPVICSPSDRTLHPPSAWLGFSCCISQVNTWQLRSCLHLPSELSLYHTLPRCWNPVSVKSRIRTRRGASPTPYPVCQALHPAAYAPINSLTINIYMYFLYMQIYVKIILTVKNVRLQGAEQARCQHRRLLFKDTGCSTPQSFTVSPWKFCRFSQGSVLQ